MINDKELENTTGEATIFRFENIIKNHKQHKQPNNIQIGKMKGNIELNPKKGKSESLQAKKLNSKTKKSNLEQANNLEEQQAVTRNKMTTNKISKFKL